jgi:UDP-glucose 4-epimerase
MQSKKRILVTGGAGFIGSHTTVELINSGYEVDIIDNLCNSNELVIDGIEKITGIRPGFKIVDLKSEKDLNEYFVGRPKYDGVIHFAALKAVGESVEKPLLYYKNNISALINLISALGENANFVFSSSCTVYGEPNYLPVDENHPIKPAESPYGQTKQMGESILRDVSKASKLKVIALRYFNPIGAHETSIIGELPLGVPNNLVPFITQTAAGIREKLTVFGEDYSTKDGTCVRDYLHVVDLAKAHVKAVEKLISKTGKENFEVFNLGTGTGFSVLEMLKEFEKISGKPLNYEVGKRREGDVEQVFANPDKAINELGWKTEKSLTEMLKSAWDWQNKLINL